MLTPEEEKELEQLAARLPTQLPPGHTLESIARDDKNWGTQRILHRFGEDATPSKTKGTRGVVARYLELKAKAEGLADATAEEDTDAQA
jgi:hypothetical protein